MASTNDDSTPQFLTKEYVEKILKNYVTDSSLKVLNIETIPATTKGDSYCSIMTRMKVNFKVGSENNIETINFLVKSSYENDSILFKTLQKYEVYNTEMQLYENVMPHLHQMLKQIGDTDELCPKTIHVDYERNVIILEDLSVRKFAMANRLEGMDEIHMKMCLKKLAKMHATAAVLNERQKGCLEKYSHGIFNRHVNCYGIFFENTFIECAKYAKTCPELGSYYTDKLMKLIPYVAEYATRCYDPKPGHFFTLTHGDIWTNNNMVQYDGKGDVSKARDVLLIDFQYCNWSSPAVDLHYLLHTSLQDDLLLNHQPKLIKYYHSILSDTLEKLKYKQHIPTLHELHIQLLERGFYAVTSTLTNLPLMINDKTEDADFETLISSNEKSYRLYNATYSNERLRRILKILLPRFDHLGLLDIVPEK